MRLPLERQSGEHLSPCKANGLTWEDQHPLIGAQHPPIGAKQVWASIDLTHWPGEHVKINNNAKHSQNLKKKHNFLVYVRNSSTGN